MPFYKFCLRSGVSTKGRCSVIIYVYDSLPSLARAFDSCRRRILQGGVLDVDKTDFIAMVSCGDQTDQTSDRETSEPAFCPFEDEWKDLK